MVRVGGEVGTKTTRNITKSELKRCNSWGPFFRTTICFQSARRRKEGHRYPSTTGVDGTDGC